MPPSPAADPDPDSTGLATNEPPAVDNGAGRKLLAADPEMSRCSSDLAGTLHALDLEHREPEAPGNGDLATLDARHPRFDQVGVRCGVAGRSGVASRTGRTRRAGVAVISGRAGRPYPGQRLVALILRTPWLAVASLRRAVSPLKLSCTPLEVIISLFMHRLP